jgi:hypothetical protein
MAAVAPGGREGDDGLVRLTTPAVAVVILLAGGACTDRGEPDTAGRTAPATQAVTTRAASISVAPTAAAPSTPAGSAATSTTATSATATVTPARPVIRRPVVDPAVCTPRYAVEAPAVAFTARPFALAYDTPPPVQVFADPALGAAGPFAVVLRIQDPSRDLVRQPTTSVNGVPTRVSVYPNGNGEAAWALPDGSVGYLRARDLDEAAVVDVLSRLTPRPVDAAVPGFDAAPPAGPDSLASVAEHRSSDLHGGGASLVCEVAGARYRISVVRGDPVAQYLSVIDNHRPLAVAPNGDGVLVILGPPSVPGAPTVADVREADPDTWAGLLDAAGR